MSAYSLVCFFVGLFAAASLIAVCLPDKKKGTFLNVYPFETEATIWAVGLAVAMVLAYSAVFFPVLASGMTGYFQLLLSALILISGGLMIAAYFVGFNKPATHIRLVWVGFAVDSCYFAGQGFYLISIDYLFDSPYAGVILGIFSILMAFASLVPLLDRRTANSFRMEVVPGKEGDYPETRRPKFEPLAFYERLYPALLSLGAAIGVIYAFGIL